MRIILSINMLSLHMEYVVLSLAARVSDFDCSYSVVVSNRTLPREP